jgi:thioredoxin-dependent peroxiredoxin
MLEVGSKAPLFRLQNQNGDTVNLSDFIGKKVVLFFYPKDDTPGCTREAIGFSEQKTFFDKKNIVVLGISKDSVKSHVKFCDKYNLSVCLLSDPEIEVNKNYGVWKEKSLYGKSYFGTDRSTFIIDESGKIEKIWLKVKVSVHIEDVISYLNN